MILVTGGTGLLGSHLLYNLTLQNDVVRAIYRSKNSLEKTRRIFNYYPNGQVLFGHIEWVQANLNNIPNLILAFDNVTHVYHCAAKISFNPKDYQSLQKTNVEGTANIVNLCLSEGVDKLCYVSSISALGRSALSSKITEETHWDNEASNSGYSITKYSAELEVWRGSQEGLKVVIINPGIIIGPGFWYSGTGLLFGYVNKGLKYYTNGVTGYVGVNDVVKCMILLMNSTIYEKRFIVVSENLSYKDYFKSIANAFHVIMPRIEASQFILDLAWRLDYVKCLLTGKPRILTKYLVKTITTEQFYCNLLITQSININFKSVDDCVRETANFFNTDL